MALGIDLTIVKDIDVKGKRVGDYFYDEESDTIFYDLPYLFPCKFAVKSLKEMYVTPMMMRLPHFLKYHDINQLRQQLHQIRCIMGGSLLLHGACWIKYGVGYLAVGFPNSGKTSIVLRECEKGAVYCSDENVIVTNGVAIPVYRKTSLNPWIAKEINYPLSFDQKVDFFIQKVKSKLFPIFEPNIWVDLPYSRMPVLVSKIIYLTEGKNQSLRLLTDNEFPFFTNPVIQTYAYATGFNLDGVYNKYTELINAFLIGVKNGKDNRWDVNGDRSDGRTGYSRSDSFNNKNNNGLA